MKANLKRLWQWLTCGDPWAAGTLVPLIASVVTGGYVFLRMVGTALMARTSGPMYHEVFVHGFGGALVAGFICGFVYPQQARIWCTGFSWPLLGWGLFCLPFALFEGPGLMIWLLVAFAMAGISILGSLIARRLRRWLVEG